MDLKEALRILFIEDNELDAELVSAHLELENVGILKRIQSEAQMTEALRTQTWDVILADDALPTFNAQAALAVLKRSGLDIPFIVVARNVGEARAIEMMKAGANDFVLKTDLSRLVPCLFREIAEAANRAARRRAEARLKNREVQLSALLENAYDGIVTTEANGRIVEFNRAAQKIFEVSREEIIGTSLTHLLTGPGRPRKMPDGSLLEYTFTTSTGRELHVEISAVKMVIENQDLVTYFIRDVTERKNQQNALIESESNFRKLADSMPQIVWTSGGDRRINYANQRWYEYTGLTPEATLGGTAADLVHPEDRAKTLAAQQMAIVNGSSMMSETRIRAANGDYRWFLIRSTAIRDRYENILRWYGTFTDIHEQKLAAEELEHAKNIAENANRAKSNFLANMSHEIRTPLGAILGFAELMADPEQNAQERLEYIEIIKRNGDQLSRVISEILDLSKVESDRLQLERVRFSLPELLSDVTTLLKLQAQEKNLTLSLKFERGLPTFIVSDPTRLRQILINVVGNAIKFTSRGEVVLSARAVKADGAIPECVRFEISDTGPGISEDQAIHLFEPFMQGDSSMTRKFGGTGLGLALSRRLAKALGGDLRLEKSDVGVGSTFVFTIETGLTEKQQKENGVDADFATVLQSVRPAPARSGPDLTGTSILVVDDSPDNCSLISYILSRAGAKVDTKNDGRSGCEQALKAKYDLVFMDIQMPRMDGFEAAEYLRAHEFHQPLVAITAHAMKGDRERCLNAGFRDHMTKPIDRKLLLDIAARMMDL
jgi:PAS domain S-box-containing protein